MREREKKDARDHEDEDESRREEEKIISKEVTSYKLQKNVRPSLVLQSAVHPFQSTFLRASPFRFISLLFAVL